MVRLVEIAVRKHRRGLLLTPSIPCPACGKKTKAIYINTCQWCKVEWNEAQLKERERLRNEQIEISRRKGLLE